ncbi:geranylgeranyl transferase type-2 subunit beta [Nematocida homosporus]|uniref:geranylgeranyl transferase type-2 subunit beta n=1 Tax=Nematocida homosporus TaxID=1912981 RepID=UPI00221F3B8F|nr:geranylgeranyl transferase type-2 subunit beta [Nematocida homosporus]KAI5187493.1 geranylgeranyl transferase type-2 subunit beta [Nematocida homosporus]
MVEKKVHVDFVMRCLSEKTRVFYLSSPMRMSTLYWGLFSLSMLDDLPMVIGFAGRIEEFVVKCQNEDGGFGAAVGYPSSPLATLSALQLLSLIQQTKLTCQSKGMPVPEVEDCGLKRAGEFTIQNRIDEQTIQPLLSMPKVVLLGDEEDESDESDDEEKEDDHEPIENSAGAPEGTQTQESVEGKTNIEGPKDQESSKTPDQRNKSDRPDNDQTKPSETPNKPEGEKNTDSNPDSSTKPSHKPSNQPRPKMPNWVMCNAFLEKFVTDEKIIGYPGFLLDQRMPFCYTISKNLLSQLNAGGPEYFLVLTPIKTLLCDYISKCSNFDGGIGCEPGCESHVAYTFCAISTLFIIGEIGAIDTEGCARFLTQCQRKSGGFADRVDKSEDLCASFWAYSSLMLLGKSFYADTKALKAFVQSCECVTGGFSDHPGKTPNLHHTTMALSLLAMLDSTSILDAIPAMALCLYD